MRKIGIYGGTFSPPHIGHVRAAELFIQQRGLDALHVIPTYLPPHKNPHDGVTVEDRLTMCRLAFGHMERAEISEREIVRGGRSYSVLTLREYAQNGVRPEMLVGTDMFLSLESWYCFQEIFQLSTIVCMRRENRAEIVRQLDKAATRFRRDYGAEVVFLDGTATEISSSDIRTSLNGFSHLERFVPSAVYDYIRERRLYGIL